MICMSCRVPPLAGVSSLGWAALGDFTDCLPGSVACLRLRPQKPMSRPASLSPEFEIAVFAKGQSVQDCPTERMAREDAQYMVDCGVAHWVNNRYRSVMMDIEAAAFKIRDRSASMGPRITLLAVQGDPVAMAIVNGWRRAA
jgi:hypothetical protein